MAMLSTTEKENKIFTFKPRTAQTSEFFLEYIIRFKMNYYSYNYNYS